MSTKVNSQVSLYRSFVIEQGPLYRWLICNCERTTIVELGEGVTYLNMRFRSILAGFVTVLLLSISCVASACENSFDLEALGPGCHQAVIASAVHTVAGMHDCGMKMKDHSAHVQASGLCKHSVCEQQPQIVVSDQTLVHVHSLVTLQVFVTAFLSPVSTLIIRIEPADTSPARVPLLVALQTIIRV